MKKANHILDFLSIALVDCRITKGHVALYVALIYTWSKQGYTGAVAINSRDIMPLAKISSAPTYHTLIRQLSEYGYIKYEPSFYRNRKSLAYIN